MKRNAVIVIRYGKNRWFKELSNLEGYEHVLLLKGLQQTHVSPNGFVDPGGYDKIVRKILVTLSSST